MIGLLLAVSALVGSCGGIESASRIRANNRMFADGERVVFFGDSITHGGLYHAFVYDYYLTRFPDRKITFWNAGVAGDTSWNSLLRFADQVTAARPTSVVIMFGMNDVALDCWPENPTEAQCARREVCLRRHSDSMAMLADRLAHEAGDPAVFWLTPTPFDETVRFTAEQLAKGAKKGGGVGIAAALGRCADGIRARATRRKDTVVDLYGAVSDFNRRAQASDPSYTVVGRDRIHPGADGHLLMAYAFLKAQGADSLVSDVQIDVRYGRVLKSRNSRVSELRTDKNGCSFALEENALPFPVDPGAGFAAARLPIASELNQELLSLVGIPKGTWRLAIDGAAVGDYSSEELARGVNLAFESKTPQFRQAQEVHLQNMARRSAEIQIVQLNVVRWFLRRTKPSIDVDDLAAVKAYYEGIDERQRKGYYQGLIPAYLEKWPTVGKMREDVEALAEKCRQAARPDPHRYELARVGGSTQGKKGGK